MPFNAAMELLLARGMMLPTMATAEATEFLALSSSTNVCHQSLHHIVALYPMLLTSTANCYCHCCFSPRRLTLRHNAVPLLVADLLKGGLGEG